ncbi:MAG: N-formylglutamate deformylase [Gammaproteobacteria bacterium]|jgi:N-formylglutamate deformylase
MTPNITQGDSPLLLAQPHGGMEIPDSIWKHLNAQGQAKADADWHITRLYEGLVDNVTVVSNPIHRYVIDANRDPSGQSLYPGQNTTGLCPTTTFDGLDLYNKGEAPNAAEIAERQVNYHQPYHDVIQQELERIKQRHGYAILYDCHSIRSVVPYLFDGQLPDFNIGTDSGACCDSVIESLVESICESADGFTSVSNGRFRGGWTTRHYGKPSTGIHAIQMELTQFRYMQEAAPWEYLPEVAEALREHLRRILQGLIELRGLAN